MQVNNPEEVSQLENLNPVNISFWTLRNGKHLSLPPAVAVSTLDIALLTQS